MTRYWCPWCGETTRASTPDQRIACRRCVKEFWKLFGFPPRADMTPLQPGEEPGVPAAAHKRFVFTDPQTGAIIGATQAAADPRHSRRRPA